MPSNEDDDDPMDSTPYVDAVSGLYPDDAGLTHVRTLLAPLVAEFSASLIEEHAAAAPPPAPPTFGSELTLAFHPPALERGRSCWRRIDKHRVDTDHLFPARLNDRHRLENDHLLFFSRRDSGALLSAKSFTSKSFTVCLHAARRFYRTV